jgi:hypothetical protein
MPAEEFTAIHAVEKAPRIGGLALPPRQTIAAFSRSIGECERKQKNP